MHKTHCCDEEGIEGEQVYICVYCKKETKRLDLKLEIPLHLECKEKYYL